MNCNKCIQAADGVCSIFCVQTPVYMEHCYFYVEGVMPKEKGTEMDENSAQYECDCPRVGIEVISLTQNPIDVISKAAGTSYGKNDTSKKRVHRCLKSGHMSIFEHASVTFRISGISRACSHQLVRHRMASFCQESQRYTKINTASRWYVTPEVFNTEENALGELYWDVMMTCSRAYHVAIANGIKPEDARYLLPEATTTTVTMTMNCRELFHFFDMRLDKSAQWEIRYLAVLLKDTLKMYDGWDELVSMYMENRDAPKSAEDEFKKILQKAFEDYKKTRGTE